MALSVICLILKKISTLSRVSVEMFPTIVSRSDQPIESVLHIFPSLW